MPITSSFYVPATNKVATDGCISIIGMAAAGKSTIGKEIARLLDWAHIDTDNLIEAAYGVPLQQLTENLTKEEFLDIESSVVCTANINRTVVSTGGSVVYRNIALAHLRTMGPIIYIDVPLPIILERIARKPDRGLAIAPGQTIEDLFAERTALYKQEATFSILAGESSAATYALDIIQWLTNVEE